MSRWLAILDEGWQLRPSPERINMLEPSESTVAAPAVSNEASLQPLYLHLSVIDPETISVLVEAKEGRDRQELALTALKIGFLSRRHGMPVRPFSCHRRRRHSRASAMGQRPRYQMGWGER